VKIHEIVLYPDPVLAKMCEPVTVFDAALRRLVAEMFESMYVGRGSGWLRRRSPSQSGSR